MLRPAKEGCDTLATVLIFRMLRFSDWCACARVSSSDLLPPPRRLCFIGRLSVCLLATSRKKTTDQISVTITVIPKTCLSTRTSTISFKQGSHPHLDPHLGICFTDVSILQNVFFSQFHSYLWKNWSDLQINLSYMYLWRRKYRLNFGRHPDPDFGYDLRSASVLVFTTAPTCSMTGCCHAGQTQDFRTVGTQFAHINKRS